MKFLLLAAGLMAATPAAQAEIKWNGSVTARYTILNQDNNLGTSTAETRVRRQQLRADFGAGSKGDVYDWGVAFRTYSGSANSEYTYLQNNLDRIINLGEAYFRPHVNFLDTEMSVTIGRQKSVMLYDANGQNLFDKDNRWDGLGWNFQRGIFGFNMSQYVLGARNSGVFGSSSFTETDATEAAANTQGGFGYLFSFQPSVKIKLSDEVSGVFAVGYHHYTGTGDSTTAPFPYRNALHGGYPSVAADYVLVTNPRQYQIFTEWTLPMKLKFTGEYIWNAKKVFYTNTNVEADKSGLGLTLAYGGAKKRNDFGLAYTFVSRGLGSSIQAFSWSDMPIDNNAHVVDVKYALDDGLVIGAKGYLMKEKSKRDVAGVALTNNQETTQKRLEFTAGVAF